MPTLDLDPSEILLRVGSIPLTMDQSWILLGVRSIIPTTGRSVLGVFFEGFRLWTGSGPPAYCRIFTIFFSYKLGIVAFNDSAFQSWNHSVGVLFLEPNCC